MSSRAAQYARQLAQAVREQLHGAPTVGARWRRAATQCPEWCSTDRCTVRLGYVRGEHRSDPLVWRTPYGTLILTLVRTRAGQSTVEVRADVRLDNEAAAARAQAQHLAVGVDLTIRAVLADISRASAGASIPQLPARAPDALDRWLAGIADEAGGPPRPSIPPPRSH